MKESHVHIPLSLYAQEQYPEPSKGDERGFEMHDSGLESYERDIAEEQRELGKHIFRESFSPQGNMQTKMLLCDLIRALGRAPTPAELRREQARQDLFRQTDFDETWGLGGAYDRTERIPQASVIQTRSLDFPIDPREFETAPARIESIKKETAEGVQNVTRLIIKTSNQRGTTTEHPVMTTEEIEWVRDSAKIIADHVKGGRVFIAGLGLGLLNEELDTLGVQEQVVAELNRNVIPLVEPRLQKKMNGKLEIRQGDFREILQRAVDAGEQFDAISIDAFPNSADEINRDASSSEVLKLALNALKPGGMLTFYPDSRYLPQRILSVLAEAGIPRTCIHYTVSQFHASEFTHKYHYGDIMAVPCIVKPLIPLEEYDRVKILERHYNDQEDYYFAQYSRKYELDEAA